MKKYLKKTRYTLCGNCGDVNEQNLSIARCMVCGASIYEENKHWAYHKDENGCLLYFDEKGNKLK